MQQRFAAALGDDRGAQFRQLIDAPEHLLERHGLREIVILVAVGAGKIAAANGDQVRQDGVVRARQAPGDHAPFAQARAHETLRATDSGTEVAYVYSSEIMRRSVVEYGDYRLWLTDYCVSGPTERPLF